MKHVIILSAMNRAKSIFSTTVLLTTALATILLTFSIATSPGQAQAVLPTPTAQPDGRIIYIAQPGDNWWIISVKTGITQEQLYQLNNVKSDDIVMEGQQILLGIVTPTPPVPTADATTPTPNITTPQVAGFGNICVLLFDDVNGDSVRQMEELQLPNGAISLVNNIGTINQTANTSTGEEPVCFNELPEGDYNLSVAVPEGYNPTTNTNSPLTLVAGDQTTMNFGAQLSSLAQPTGPGEGGRNPILGLAGLILILGGAGLSFYFWRLRKH